MAGSLTVRNSRTKATMLDTAAALAKAAAPARAAVSATLAAILACALAQPAHADDLRDPMRPPSAPAPVSLRPATEAPLKLEAVMSTATSRIAIVNGKVLRTGDKVAGATITEITADTIRYTRGGKEKIALLPSNKVTVRVDNTLQARQP
jgi:hypothetical protein